MLFAKGIVFIIYCMGCGLGAIGIICIFIYPIIAMLITSNFHYGWISLLFIPIWAGFLADGK